MGTPTWGRVLMAVLLVTPGLVLIAGLWVRYG
jgi:hypothetical protein